MTPQARAQSRCRWEEILMGRLVGISGKVGSGKTTAAEALIENGWVRVKMAGPLKDMLRSIGLTDDHIEGNLKEVPCDLLCGQTPRHAMITLGTEWGRKQIGSDLWASVAAERIRLALGAGFSVVVDDVRFENEAAVIRKLGGVVVRIIRPDTREIQHESEAGVEPDFIQSNSGTTEDLRRWVVDTFINQL